MAITVTHQKPAVLDPIHAINYTGDYDPMPAITTALVDPLHEPLNPAVPAIIVNGKGHDLVPDLPNMLMSCLGDDINASAESAMKSLFFQTLVNYDPAATMTVQELYVSQAGNANKMPAPGPRVLYTAKDDIVPAAKELLSGTGRNDKFFAAVGYAYHPNTLGFWFQTEAVFDEFKTWLVQQVTHLNTVLPQKTMRMFTDFNRLTLDGLTESLLLRKDDGDNNDEFSFPRVIVHMLMSWVKIQHGQNHDDLVGTMPFTIGELFCPRSLVLVNVDAHARTKPSKIDKEWRLINSALASPIKMVSNSSLSKLTAAQRYTNKMRAMAVSSSMTAGQPGSRSANIVFRKRPPTKVNIFTSVMRVLKRMGTVNRSQNIFRSSKTTFLKANRRDPDDYNKPGRITSVTYLPDIHVFVDTSGSISEENYQDAVMMLIRLAKKLNVNLYFSSFSHLLSQETLLKVENKSIAQIWQEFRRIPKVTGMTDYLQIWRYINASPKRKRRLSLVVTDFEWTPPNGHEEHPPNIYYAPCSGMDWARMRGEAKDFSASMMHIDPSIHQRMLGMYV